MTGRPGGLGLDGGDPELLGRGDDAAPGALRSSSRGAVVGDAALEADGRPGEAAQAPRVGPVADDDQRQAAGG